MPKDNCKISKTVSNFQYTLAKSTGFDWPGALPVIEKLKEEVAELKEAVTESHGQDKIAEEYGDILFVLLNLANHLQLDPDKALYNAHLKFKRRFDHMLMLAKEEGIDFCSLSLSEQETLWSRVKEKERVSE